MPGQNQKKPRVLLLGCTGQLGTELQKILPRSAEVVACSRETADLADAASIRAAVQSARPNYIVNAAAYTAVDRAESEPEKAFAINASASGILAEEAVQCNAWLLHFSTDYVFDGSAGRPWLETDAPHPLNVYGKSKLAGEEAIAATGCRHLIFRTSWVYAAHGNNFLCTMLRLAAERPRLTIVDDQIGSPTAAHELARGVCAVLARLEDQAASSVASGVYHMTCGGSTSWYGFAVRIFSEFQGRIAAPELVPIPSDEFKTPAVRPRYSVLDNGKLERVFGLRLASWEDALARVAENY